MSIDPNRLLSSLHFHVETDTNLMLTAREAEWILAQLKHKDDRIEALSNLLPVGVPGKPAAAARPAETICQEADRIVSRDRQPSYGHPKDDFQRTAAMWEPMLGLPPGAISPEKVAYCMIAVKLSRLCHGYQRDSAVDLAGYAKCASLICE